MWYYKTEVGTFLIYRNPNDPARFLLKIENEILGSYLTPEMAADDVYMQATGWYEWDTLPNVSGPTDLSEWHRNR